MNGGGVLCVGELVWDLFPEGPRLGGAPLNVAVHLARQGVNTVLLTAVGRDALGDAALRFLQGEGISGVLTHPRLPTGTVAVTLDAGGGPAFAIHGGAAWTDLAGAHGEGTPPLLPDAAPSVVVFGALAMHGPANRQVLEQVIQDLTRRRGSAPVRLCDLNLRPGWSEPEVAAWCATQADVLKVNTEELRFLGERALLDRYALQGLCITHGSEGLEWLDARGERFHLPAWTEPGAVVLDTVGAGDAVTASIALGLARGEPPYACLDRGRRWAAQVCAVRGALPARHSLLP